MKKMLVVVDVQNDFVSGTLGSDSAKAIIPTIEEIVKDADARSYPIVFTADTHEEKNYKDFIEGQKVPTHCIYGEWGWRIIDELDEYTKHYPVVPKIAFGAFNLPIQKVDEICIVGLCTDICVISNALILRSMFPTMPITIYEDACAGTTPEAHQAALKIAASCLVDVKKWNE